MPCRHGPGGLKVEAKPEDWPGNVNSAGIRAKLRPPENRPDHSMDIVFIRDLRIETVIGVYDWERKIRQTVSIDLEMGTDIRPAAVSDHIQDALDYKSVAKRLIQFIGDSEFQLVETLAQRCADIILNEFQVPWLRLRLAKPGAVTGSQDVGVLIERSRG